MPPPELAPARRPERRSAASSTILPRRHPWRLVASAIVLVVIAQFVHGLVSNGNFQWQVVGQYVFFPAILQGLLVTLQLTAITMVAGIVLGILLALMRMSGNYVLRAIGTAYVWFFRGTPLLVQLIFWYNLSALYPTLSIGIPFGPEFATAATNDVITVYTAALLGLGLNEAAYMTEIVRGGILAVDSGQTDASLALGMSQSRLMVRIVLPQAMRYIVPPTGNQLISLLKATSLVSVIAMGDLLFAAEKIYARTYQPIPLLITASLWYLAVTSVLMLIQRYIERYYGRGHSRSAV